MYDKYEIKSASLTLIRADNADILHRYLMGAVNISGKTPVRLTGDGAAMNPLLWLAQTDRPKFDAVLLRADELRIAAGADPLRTYGFQKNAYQTEFMAQGRQRRGRASTLENLDRPERDKLRGAARLEFERVVQARWKQQLDALISKARVANGGTVLPKAAMDSLRSRFWAGVDTALDEKEAAARQGK